MGHCLSSSPTDKEPLSRQSSSLASSTNKPPSHEQELIDKHRKRVLKRNHDREAKEATINEEQLRETLNEIFDAYDLKGDGELDLEEFMAMLNGISVRKQGLKAKLLDRQEVRRVLAKNDKDGNVRLDKNEFYDLYKKG